MLEPLAGDLADDPDREPGPRERMAPDHRLRQAELLADPADLVLEQHPQRLHELEVDLLGQAADVVVRLDLGRHARVAAGLDHVRVERALDEVRRRPRPRPGEPPRLLLEDADELLPDPATLLLRLLDPLEPGEEALARVHVDERHVEMMAERLHDLLGLALAQQAVVDEDAGEPVADRLVDEQGRDGRVDAAGEPADDRARSRPGRAPARPPPRSPRPGSRPGARPRRRTGTPSGARCPCGVCTTSGWNCTP